jgi:hypothetical protein
VSSTGGVALGLGDALANTLAFPNVVDGVMAVFATGVVRGLALALASAVCVLSFA